LPSASSDVLFLVLLFLAERLDHALYDVLRHFLVTVEFAVMESATL
jgi:hypothetical protein